MSAIGRHHVKWSEPGAERQKMHVFSQMWKIDARDKQIHKNKHGHIQTHAAWL
jgi:hypothetical protein